MGDGGGEGSGERGSMGVLHGIVSFTDPTPEYRDSGNHLPFCLLSGKYKKGDILSTCNKASKSHLSDILNCYI